MELNAHPDSKEESNKDENITLFDKMKVLTQTMNWWYDKSDIDISIRILGPVNELYKYVPLARRRKNRPKSDLLVLEETRFRWDERVGLNVEVCDGGRHRPHWADRRERCQEIPPHFWVEDKLDWKQWNKNSIKRLCGSKIKGVQSSFWWDLNI